MVKINTRADCNTLVAISGLKVFNSKWPFEPPIDMVASFPIIWAHTIQSPVIKNPRHGPGVSFLRSISLDT